MPAGMSMPSALVVLRVDCQIEFGGLHDRKVAGLLTLENASGVNTDLAISVGDTWAVAAQTAIGDVFA